VKQTIGKRKGLPRAAAPKSNAFVAPEHDEDSDAEESAPPSIRAWKPKSQLVTWLALPRTRAANQALEKSYANIDCLAKRKLEKRGSPV
jgi:hypothetical protein